MTTNPPTPDVPIPPPSHLSESSQTLWRQIVPKKVKAAQRLALLQVALEALDRLNEIRDRLSKGDWTPSTTGKMVHVTPLLAYELKLRNQVIDIWRNLGLDSIPYDYRNPDAGR